MEATIVLSASSWIYHPFIYGVLAMHTLIRRNAIVLLVIVAVSAGCSGEAPTSTAIPAGPEFDTGVGFGSGNRGMSPENTAAADSGSTAGRGGVGFGSGN